MRLIYMIAADVLRGLGWEVEINEKDSYWNLVLTNTTSSEDMPESHKSCLRGLLRGWLMEFNFEGGRQQVNIYKVLHGLYHEDDRYSCLDTCVNRTDGNTPQSELNDKEIFVRRKDRFDRYVLAEPIADPSAKTVTQDEYFREVSTLNGKIRELEQKLSAEQTAYDEYQERSKVKCKRCGAEMPDAKRTCSECGAVLEGYALNNVTGEYGYRGADGNFYKSEEEYRSQSSAAVQSPIYHLQKGVHKKIAEITISATKEKLMPLIHQMTELISQAFQVGFDAGLECGKYTDYTK